MPTAESLVRRAWLLLPSRVRASRFAERPTRFARRVVGSRVDAGSLPAPGPRASVRVIRTLDELDEMLVRLDEAAMVSDDELRRAFATFEMELDLGLPDDPYSPEYRAQVFALYEFLRGDAYDVTNEVTHFDLDAAVSAPFPYSTQSAQTVGNQLIAIGHIIKTMDLPAGSRVLELGPGWGNTTLALAQMGHRVTAIDIDTSFVRLIAERAARVGVEIDVRQGDFSQVEHLSGEYDAVLFFESFHHSSDHLGLLRSLDRVVAPGGSIVFAAEPISESLPAPWCLRLDGESLWAIRRNGWFELGFRESYFLETLARCGWKGERTQCADSPWGVVFVARRRLPSMPPRSD